MQCKLCISDFLPVYCNQSYLCRRLGFIPLIQKLVLIFVNYLHTKNRLYVIRTEVQNQAESEGCQWDAELLLRAAELPTIPLPPCCHFQPLLLPQWCKSGILSWNQGNSRRVKARVRAWRIRPVFQRAVLERQQPWTAAGKDEVQNLQQQ